MDRLIRADFPILERRINGLPLVYLDNAATTHKPRSVIQATSMFYATSNSNVHRGIHALSEEATREYERARDLVQVLINARLNSEIVFVRNTTEAINLVAKSWGATNIHADDIILLTEMEHHSNLIPWLLLAKERLAQLAILPVDSTGLLQIEDLDHLLDERVRLIAVTGMSNVLGTINPIEYICRRAHEGGALVLVDGAQIVPHIPVDVQALDCDFLAFSGHKMLGPTGIGVLYARNELLKEMPPFLAGGEMVADVTLPSVTFRDPPLRFEAGTPAIAQAVGLGAAVEYLQRIGLEHIHQHERKLVEYAIGQLKDVPGIEIYGPETRSRGGIVSFNLHGVHAHDLADSLDNQAIAIRAGHHCAQPLARKLGVSATARASFYLYNTFDEVDRLVEAILAAREVLCI